jgi:hypothetical protein
LDLEWQTVLGGKKWLTTGMSGMVVLIDTNIILDHLIEIAGVQKRPLINALNDETFDDLER